jgi:hypothetical protein
VSAPPSALGQTWGYLESGLLHEDRELRIGVFPTAANLFHWARLLGGLIVMERFLLDKVIFVIAGQDSRRPKIAPEDIRHSMAKEVLELFHPLFEYSSIALGTTTSGEENLFKIQPCSRHSRLLYRRRRPLSSFPPRDREPRHDSEA